MRESWQEKRLKFIAPLSRRILPGKPLDARYLGLENIESGTGKLHLETEQELVESSVISFDGNSILFGKLRPYLAKVATPDFDGVASTEIMVLLPANGNDRGFLAYSLRSDGFIRRVSALTDGAKMPRANPSNVMNLDLPLPSFFLQRRIAAYLDRQTEKIDRLMNLRRRQIELLKEQRAAIIQRAVTRGLNADAPMKDSGIPWLGEIPAHWEITRIEKIASIKARLGWKGLKAEEYVEDGYIFLSTPNIKNDDIDFQNVNYITKARYEESPEIMLHEGDVLLAKDGATLGITALVKSLPAPATVNGSIAVIRPSEQCSGCFLALWLSSHGVQKYIDMMKGGMGVPHLFQRDLRRFPVPLPPREEQIKISALVEKRRKKINEISFSYSRQFALLAEYRAALIHECVTGRKEIPEPPLPPDREVAHAL